MAKTKYQELVSAKKSLCEGKKTKTAVKAAAKKYIDNAIAKAKKAAPAGKKETAAKKAKTSATQKANVILNKGCKMSAVVAGKKKRTAKKAVAKRKTTKRKATK